MGWMLTYLSDVSTGAPQPGPSLSLDETLLSAIKSLTQQQLQKLVCEALPSVHNKRSLLQRVLCGLKLSTVAWEVMINTLLDPLSHEEKMPVLDKKFVDVARSQGIDTNPARCCFTGLKVKLPCSRHSVCDEQQKSGIGNKNQPSAARCFLVLPTI